MTDTTFVDQQTIIQAAWCNDINDHVYNDTPISPSTTVHDSSKISNSIKRVANIAAIRSITPVSTYDVETQGYYTAGDGGNGTYYGVTGAAAGTYVDNGGTIIVPTGGDGSSAWLIKGDYVYAKQFGAKADGVADDTAKIQAALNSHSCVHFGESNNTYKVTGAISIPVGRKLLADGATISASGNFNTFATANPSVTSSAVSSWTPATGVAVVANGALFTSGSVVKLSNGSISLYSEVVSVAGNNVTLADRIDWTLSGSLTLYNTSLLSVVIDGLKFTKTWTGAFYDVSISGSVYGAEVRNCSFSTASGVSASGVGYISVRNNLLYNVTNGIWLYDVCHSSVVENTVHGFLSAIRSTFSYNNTIANNDVRYGTDSSYSVGIEISGWDLTTLTDKATNNKIEGNSVINAQKGIAGSAIGGIHLHRNCKNNVVSSNISNYNGIGIYLETSNTFNQIINNICNYNGGYYGVGIQLDTACSNNVITGNSCSYNSGSATADESCGIEVRNGTSSGANSCDNNVVSNNMLIANGGPAAWVNGTGNVLSANIMFGNGTNASLTKRNEIYVSDASSLVISGNNINASSGAGSVMNLSGVSRLNLANNNIYSANTHDTVFSISGATDVVTINRNTVLSDATGTLLYANGTVGRHLTYISFEDNYFNQQPVGTANLNLQYVDGWNDLNNRWVQPRTYFTASVTNRWGEINTTQANSTAPDVATIVADFNTLLGKLRSGGVLGT